jgi:hypothetical protein
MRHRNYHEVDARTPAELGAKLGALFAHKAHENIDYARRQKHWRGKVEASLPLLDCTRRQFPHHVEELQAYSQAAGVALDELWAVSLEDELDEFKNEKCTTVVTNSGRLISHNEDWDEDSDEEICLLKKSCAGLTILEIYYYAVPLGGSALSINSNGYVQAINSLDHADRQIGVPKSVIGRWMSETGDARADFARLRQIPRSSGYNHVLVHRRDGVLDIECTAARQVLLEPSLPFAHTNHLLSPGLKGLDNAEAGEGTYARYECACQLVRPMMTLAELATLTGDTSRGRKRSINNRETIARVVIDLDSRIAKVWLRREQKLGWIDYPLDFVPPR